MFCLTGISKKYKRREIAEMIELYGGFVTDRVSAKVNYLLVCDDKNECWAFSCYGRKIEQAISHRQKGAQVVIVHEDDFFDALEKLSSIAEKPITMGTFTAIDFETAQGKRWSICQIGIVRIVNGKVTDKVNRLIRPPGNSYNYYNTQVHGIDATATKSAPDFDQIWPEISHLIHGQIVVAHNGAFDFSCLTQVLDYYQLSHPVFEKQCTYKIYGKKLSLLCQEYGIELNHHDALSDAMACAELYRRHLGI